MIVSLHPHFKGDVNIPPRGLEARHEDALRRARAVVVSQGVSERDYTLCRAWQPRVFPNYDRRFGREGKTGARALFREADLPHPETRVYDSVKHWLQEHPDPDDLPFIPPFVMKVDQGGCGFGIFRVDRASDVRPILEFMADPQKNSTGRFVAQQWVNHGGRDLRVVVIGNSFHAYWRCQDQAWEFRNNVGRGAFIDPEGDPEKTRRGVDLVTELARRTGLNLAAVDVLFDGLEGPPLLGEINFAFGRKGLGGTRVFREIFAREARAWIGESSNNHGKAYGPRHDHR